MKKVFLLAMALVGAATLSGQSLQSEPFVYNAHPATTSPREEIVLTHTQGNPASLIGSSSQQYKVDMAHLWEASALSGYVGWHIQKVEFAYVDQPNHQNFIYTIMIWDGETSQETLISTLVDKDQHTVPGNVQAEFSHDFEIKAGKDYYIGVRTEVTTGGYPLVIDDQAGNSGYSDLYRFAEDDGTFGDFNALGNMEDSNFHHSFYIKAYLHNGTGTTAVLGNQATAFVQDGMININNAKGEAILYNMNGQIVYRGAATSFAAPMERGVYVLKVAGQSIKLAI